MGVKSIKMFCVLFKIGCIVEEVTLFFLRANSFSVEQNSEVFLGREFVCRKANRELPSVQLSSLCKTAGRLLSISNPLRRKENVTEALDRCT